MIGPMENTIRLNKYISHNTRYSRREADSIIQSGRVKIGNKVQSNPGVQITPGEDRVFLDGKPVHIQTQYTVLVYNKPKGELVTKKDSRGRRTIYDSLPSRFSHFLSVGRLDFASEGVLLMSDSAKIVTALMESDLERVYKIKIDGPISKGMELAMKEGLKVEDARAGGHEKSEIEAMDFAPFYAYQVQKVGRNYSTLKVAIGEGKNRELRRFFAHFGVKVLDLKRVSYGGVELNNLPSGKFRYLEKAEYKNLRTFLKELALPES